MVKVVCWDEKRGSVEVVADTRDEQEEAFQPVEEFLATNFVPEKLSLGKVNSKPATGMNL